MLNRKSFLDTLRRIQPALLTNDQIPVFGCFCFTGDEVYTWNDVVALKMPFESSVIGGVSGKPLLEWLTYSTAKEIDFSGDDNEVTVKAGKDRLNLPLVDKDNFLFIYEPDTKPVELTTPANFLKALAKSIVSMGKDQNNPKLYGVTFCPAKEGGKFYSSNDTSATKSWYGKTTEPLGSDCVLPPQFVSLCLSISKESPLQKLMLSEDGVEGHFESGLVLFSRLIAKPDVKEFQRIFKDAAAQGEHLKPVPKGFEYCLKRANAMLSFGGSEFATLAVKENRFSAVSSTQKGNALDSVPFVHENASVQCIPAFLLQGLGFADKLIIQDRWIIMSGRSFLHVIGTAQE